MDEGFNEDEIFMMCVCATPTANDAAAAAADDDDMFISFQAHMDLGYNIGPIMSQHVLQLYPENREIRILDCGAGTGLIGQEVRPHHFTSNFPIAIQFGWEIVLFSSTFY